MGNKFFIPVLFLNVFVIEKLHPVEATAITGNDHQEILNGNGGHETTSNLKPEPSAATSSSSVVGPRIESPSTVNGSTSQKATYELISKSIVEQPNPSQECDDEDNCKPSYSGSGDDEDSNDGSGENGDKTMTLSKSNDTNSYVRGLSPGTEKSSNAENGDRPSEPKYELISKSVMEQKNSSNAGNDDRPSEPKYELISKSVMDQENPSIGCDDEDNCKPSYRGSGDEEDKNNGSEENGDTTITPPASNSTNSNVRGLRPTIEKSSNGGNGEPPVKATYELISKSTKEQENTLPSKECDDEDDCQTSKGSSGDDNNDLNGRGGKDIYFVVIKTAYSQENKSSNVGLGELPRKPTYEIISKAMLEPDNTLSNQDCDDEDDCKSSYSGSGDDSDGGGGGSGEYSVTVKIKALSPPKDKTGDMLSCNENPCGDGGLCELDKKTNKAKCICSISKRGTFCSEGNNFTFPKFSGNSYMKLPPLSRHTWDGSEIYIEFKTDAKNGLILYSGNTMDGTGDFFSVIIVNGRVRFSFDCGSGLAVASSTVNIRIGHWHKISIFRSKQRGWLSVDGEKAVNVSSPGRMHSFEMPLSLMVGGLPEYKKLSPKVDARRGLIGCIKVIKVGKEAISLTYPSPDSVSGRNVEECHGELCSDFCTVGSCYFRDPKKPACRCPLHKTGERCEKDEPLIVPLFMRSSFLIFPPLGKKAAEYLVVEMIVKPLEKSGLILYNGKAPQKMGDFISLSLRKGFVELSFNCGSGTVRIRSMKPVVMNKWHEITFYRSERLGSLTVNAEPPAVGYSPGPYNILSLEQNLHIGGITDDLKSEVNFNAGVKKGFAGYIQNVKINGKALSLISDAISGNVENDKTHPCSLSPCKNGGTCTADLEKYTCSCTPRHRGPNCENEISLIAMAFQKESYLRFNKSALLNVLKEHDSAVRFMVKTTKSKGLIIWEFQRINQYIKRYVAVSLKSGYVRLSYDIGFGQQLVYSPVRVNDGQWHKVQIERREGIGSLVIDKKHLIKFKAVGEFLGTDVDLYMGGVPDIALVTKGIHHSGFTGCLKKFQIGKEYLDFINDSVAAKDTGPCVE